MSIFQNLDPPMNADLGWHRPLAEPSFRKSAIAVLAAGLTMVPVAAAPETVTVDKWFQQWTTPPKTLAKRGQFAAAQEDCFLGGAAPFTERVSEDKWHVPWSEPVRKKPGLGAHIQSSATFVPVFSVPEVVNLDKWFEELSKPQKLTPRGQFTAAQDHDFLVKAALFPEAVSIDKWLQALAEPVRKKPGLGAHLQSSTAFVAVLTAPETVTLDKWFQEWSTPVRVKPRLPAGEQQFLAFSKFPVIPVDVTLPVVTGGALVGATLSTTTGNWDNNPTGYTYQWYVALLDGSGNVLVDGNGRPLGTPIGGATSSTYGPLVSSDETNWFFSEVTATNNAGSDTIQSDAVGPVTDAHPWMQALNEPVRSPRRLHPATQGFNAFVPAAPFAEAVSLDKWLRPLNEPLRKPARLFPGLQPNLTFVPVVVSTEVVTVDKWFAPLAEPVRQKKGLATHLQQALAFVPVVVPPEVVTLDKWFAAWSLPGRTPRRELPGAQPASFLTKAAPFGETITQDKWFQPLSRPTLPKPSFHVRAPAFFFAPIPIFVAQNYILEVTTSPVITITFPDVTLEVRRVTADMTGPRVRSFEMPWRTFIAKLDPDFDKHKKVTEYEFEDRIFEADPDKRWPYDS